MTAEFLIGEIAKQFGISTQTIRYYESLNLIKPSRRTQKGYRLYSQIAIERLQLIKSAQNFGLSLDEIKRLTSGDRGSDSVYQTFKNMVESRLQQLDMQLEQVTKARQELSKRLEQINYLISTQNANLQNEENYTEQISDSLLSWLKQIEANLAIDDQNTILNKADRLLQLYTTGERNFQGMELIGVELNGAFLNDADFSHAEMMLAHLNEVSMANTKLNRAYLSGADLIGAYLSQAELVEADLIGVDLTDADLSGANLAHCNLGGADLSGANLTGANLSETIFVGANLSGANLTDTILLGCNFQEANLTDAIFDRGAIAF